VDQSDGCGSKFDLVLVSTTFEGKPLLARHRAVNGALASEIAAIHALTMKTYTPEQWATMNA
jgi:stress-induced morphogen